MPYRVAFDVGGTFTDFVLQSPTGELTTAKRLTTYPDPSEACLAGLDDLLGGADAEAAAGSSVRWSDVAQALRLPPGSSAYRVIGVRHGDHGPFQHVTAYVPAAFAGVVAEEDLSKTSIVGVIERQMGVAIKLLEQVTDAALAPRHVAELLQVRPRTPLLLFERTYLAANGEPVEHAISYQTGRRYPYRVVLSRADRRS